MEYPSNIIGPIMIFTGAVASVNSWHGASRGNIYETQKYRQSKENMTIDFFARWGDTPQIDYRVDISLHVILWKMKDTDGCLKPIIDSLEDAKIIENDNLIRNITVTRAYHPKKQPDYVCVYFTKIEEPEETEDECE